MGTFNFSFLESFRKGKMGKVFYFFPTPVPFCPIGVAAPGFNSLIPMPSVPSLISTELVELLCRASNVSTTDLSASSNKNRKRLKLSCSFFIYKYAQLRPACVERKFTAIKAATTQPLITIKQSRDVAAAPQTPQLGGPRPTLGAQVSLKLLFGYVTIFSSADLFTTDLNCRKKLACDIISECNVILSRRI